MPTRVMLSGRAENRRGVAAGALLDTARGALVATPLARVRRVVAFMVSIRSGRMEDGGAEWEFVVVELKLVVWLAFKWVTSVSRTGCL